MAGKYYTTTVLPDMGADGATTALSTAFTDKDILFDWHAFDIPKGANRLLSITSIVHGTDGVDQDIAGGTTLDYELIFAKDREGVVPPTLGVNNAGVTGEGWYNHVIGRVVVDSSLQGDEGNLIRLNIASTDLAYNGGAGTYVNCPLVLQGDNDPSYIKDGYDRIYVAGITLGALDFNTGVLINMTDSDDLAAYDASDATKSTATLTVDGTDCRNVFAVGDVLVAQDGAAVGTIKSIDSDVQITLTAKHTDALANNDELFHQSPIRLIMSFER
tara:strand:+ start:42 stop:860 length:819 start_codon:yes stop_codon:yes gene_type:complete